MSFAELPFEIVHLILGYLDAKDILKCRVVSRRCREAVDSLPDSCWEYICLNEVLYPQDYVKARQRNGLSWRDTYKALNSWPNIRWAPMKTHEVDIQVQHFKLLPHSIIACAQNNRHQTDAAYTKNHGLNRMYSDTIVFYDLEAMKEIGRHDFDFVFVAQQFDVNENFIVLLLHGDHEESNKLCIVLRANLKQFFVGNIEGFWPYHGQPYVGDFTMFEKEVFFKNYTDKFIYFSKLVEEDGEVSMSTKPLESTPFNENIVAFTKCPEGSGVLILTDEGDVLCYEENNTPKISTKTFIPRYSYTIMSDLDDEGFDWQTRSILDWISYDGANHLSSSSNVALYAHARCDWGMIFAVNCTKFSAVNIYKTDQLFVNFNHLSSIINKYKPTKTVDKQHQLHCEDIAKKYISQIDILETPTTHKVLTLRHPKLTVSEFAPWKSKSSIRKRKHAMVGNKQNKTGKSACFKVDRNDF